MLPALLHASLTKNQKSQNFIKLETAGNQWRLYRVRKSERVRSKSSFHLELNQIDDL